MSATTAIVQVTASNVLGLRRMLGFGLLAVFPGVVYFIASRQATAAGKAENFTGFSIFVFLAIVVPIITVVMAASVLGSERRGETLSFLMLRPISRYSIAAAKLVSAIVASFAISALGVLLLGIQGAIDLGSIGHVAALLGATLLANAGYSAVFMPIGYLTERATLTGFIYIFVWETAVSAIVVGLSGTSLWRIAASAFVGLAPSGLDIDITETALGSLVPGAGGAFIKIAVVCAVSVALTGWLLRTRDLT